MHLDNNYVRKGEIDAEKLFARTDVTEEVKLLMPDVPKNIKHLLRVIESKKCPEISIGNYCKDDYGVHLNDKFWKEHPDCTILNLTRGGQKAVDLFNKGVLRLKDVPTSVKINEKQAIQVKCDKVGEVHISKKGISDFIGILKYPLHFMDFETFSTAIPMYNGLKSYQRVPFQFSLWIIEKEGAKPEYYSFIADGKGDSRAEFIKILKPHVKDKGSILVYYAPFEKGILKELAEAFPIYNKWVDSINKRIADLHAPFDAFYYYNPLQKGKTSIKVIMPIFVGKSYEDLAIRGGETALIEYLRAVIGEAPDSEKKKVLKDLEEYCKRDTEGMIWILDKLKDLIK